MPPKYPVRSFEGGSRIPGCPHLKMRWGLGPSEPEDVASVEPGDEVSTPSGAQRMLS